MEIFRIFEINHFSNTTTFFIIINMNPSIRNRHFWKVLYPRIVIGAIFFFILFFLLSSPKIIRSIVENQNMLINLQQSFYQLQSLYMVQPTLEDSPEVQRAQEKLEDDLAVLLERPFFSSMREVDEEFNLLLWDVKEALEEYSRLDLREIHRSEAISKRSVALESLIVELKNLVEHYADQQVFTIQLQNTFLIIVIGLFIVVIIYLDTKGNIEERNKERMRSLSRRYLNELEKSHKKTALDIHDIVLQELAIVCRFNHQLKEKTVSGNSNREWDIVDTSLDKSIKTLRGIIDDIQPWNTSAIAFPTLVHTLADTFLKDESIDHLVTVDTIPKDLLTEEEKQQILAILKEALSNIRKHAEATKVEVLVLWRKPWMIMTVKDNGKGFVNSDNRAVTNSNHIGLFSMRERAAMIDGSVQIFSRPGSGTTVTMTMKTSRN